MFVCVRNTLAFLLLTICAAVASLRAEDTDAPLVRAYKIGSQAKTRAEIDPAIEICREALATNLKDADLEYARRLLAWQLTRRGRFAVDEPTGDDANHRQGALADFTEAIELDPRYVNARLARAAVEQRLGQWEDACHDLRQALQLAPNDPTVLRATAWLLSTAPDEQYRDEKLALEAAKRAVTLSQDHDFRSLDVASAAEANAGNYQEAARLAHRALQMSRTTAPPNEQAAIRRRMELYHRNHAYRQLGSKGNDPAGASSPATEATAENKTQDVDIKEVKRSSGTVR